MRALSPSALSSPRGALGLATPTLACAAFGALLTAAIGYGVASGFGPAAAALLLGACAVCAMLVLPSRLVLQAWLFVPFAWFYFKLELPAGMPDLDAERLFAFAGLTVLLAKASLRQERGLISLRAFGALPLLFLGLRTASALHSPLGLVEASYFLLGGVWLPMIVYLFALRAVETRQDLNQILDTIMLLGIVAAPFGLVEAIFGLSENAFAYLGARAKIHVWAELSGTRAAGPFINPASYGAMLGLATLAATRTLVSKQREGRLRAWIALALCPAGVALCFTRGAWLGVACGLVVFLVVARRWRALVAALGGLGTLLVGLALAGQLTAASGSSGIGERTMSGATVLSRLALLERGVLMTSERPIAGWGIGGYADNHAAFASTYSVSGEMSSHNTYLGIAVDSGIPAALVLLLLIGHRLLKGHAFARLAATTEGDRLIAATLMGGIVIYAVIGLTLDHFYLRYDSAVWFALLALLGTLAERREAV